MRLPVHCCCEPAKRLGFVDVDDRMVRRGGVVFLAHIPGVRGGYETLWTEIEYVQLEPYPRRLLPCGHYTIALRMRVLAVKSADKPLEDWLNVSAFKAI